MPIEITKTVTSTAYHLVTVGNPNDGSVAAGRLQVRSGTGGDDQQTLSAHSHQQHVGPACLVLQKTAAVLCLESCSLPPQ